MFMPRILFFYILVFSFLSFISLWAGNYVAAMVFNMGIPLTILLNIVILALKNRLDPRNRSGQNNDNHQANP